MSGSAACAGTARNQWGLTGQEPERLAAYSLISTFQGSGYLQALSFSSPDPKPSITLPHTFLAPPPRHPSSLCFFSTPTSLSSSPGNSPLPQGAHTSPGASNMGCRSWAISLAIRAASTAFSATLLAATAFRRASAALLGPRDRDLSDFLPCQFIHALMLQPLTLPPPPPPSHLSGLSYLWSHHPSAQSWLLSLFREPGQLPGWFFT